MANELVNSNTLAQVGLMLLPNERVEVCVELEDGLTEELEQRCATLLLTNERLIRYSAGAHKNNVVSVLLADVNSIEVNRTEKNRQWIGVGVVFIAGGLLLSLLPLFYMSSPVSLYLMALSLTLIGIVFLITYFSGKTGEVIVRAGLNDIKCKMKPKALDDMVVFVQRFYEMKLGYTAGASPQDGHRHGQPLSTSGASPAGGPTTTSVG